MQMARSGAAVAHSVLSPRSSVLSADAGIAEIARNLAEQEQVYVALERLAVEKRTAIVGADVVALTASVREELRLMEAAARLEDARVRAVEAWAAAAAHPMPASALTVTTMAGAAGDGGAALLAARERLVTVVETVRTGNEENAALVALCLESVTHSLQNLGHLVQREPQYSADGRRPGPRRAGSRLLDYQA